MLRRIRGTHDIHHLVLGVDTSVAGEAAAIAYYAVSQQMPATLVPLATFMTHSFIKPDEHSQIWAGMSFGTQVGLAGVFLEGCRWEEGWERPLEEWRSELGLLPLLENSPFQDEIHRWKTLSSG
jgi:ubiquinone biosynthesis protein Coq4